MMFKPLFILEDLVRTGKLSRPAVPTDQPNRKSEKAEFALEGLPPDMPDDELFIYAVRNVKALGWSNVPLQNRPPVEIQPQDDEAEALRALEEFIENGDIASELTPGYIEGAAEAKGRLYLDDLRSGRFSVQAWLDLHGMNRQEARFALDEFLMDSVRDSLSCVRVVHGRGRHSHKQQSILKNLIQRWLCSRRLGRHVIAYTSARRYDGGDGAVYILLRR
jgi:DNA-nicking Smr family endonuclease